MSVIESRRLSRLNLRATAREDALIRTAAEVRGVNVSEFILESACASAERELADRTRFEVSEEKMVAFVEALDRPAKANPRLRKLFAEPSILES